MIFQLLIAYFIYAFSFCMMENTIYRLNSNGVSEFSIIPLFTEGLIGPIRSLYLTLRYNGIKSLINYMMYLFINLNNMFGSTFFTFYILSIIENNFMPRSTYNYETISQINNSD